MDMDQDRFDDLARLLGAGGTRRTGLRAALGGLLGLGLGAAVVSEADAGNPGDGHAARGRRRRRCTPPCTNGFTCVKVGRTHACECVTGAACGAACCARGETCQAGACAPAPTGCIPAGEPCKDAGRPCCDGRVCASGQGGMDDVACYAPKTARCEATADCVYGTVCTDGRCGLPAPAGLGQPCNPANQQACVTPGAVCVPYDDPAAPDGVHCALPSGRACAADRECIGHHCGWVEAGQAAGAGRPAAREAVPPPRRVCCGGAGSTCASDRDCCMGETCVAGACAPCALQATHRYNVPMPNAGGGYDPADGLGFLPDGRMVVSNGTASGVYRGVRVFTDLPGAGWTPTAQFSNQPGGGGMNYGLAVSPDGTVYDAQYLLQYVSIWRDTGTGAGWEQVGQIGDGSGTDIQDPFSVALLPDGRVVVGEAAGSQVSIWQGAGNDWTRVAEFAHAPGTYPWAVAATPDGDVYVMRTDYIADCSLTLWRETAGAWAQVDTVGSPVCGVDWSWFGYGVVAYGPYLLVADEEISVWSREAGAWVRRTQFGFPNATTPDAPDALNEPFQLAVGPNGLVYVADSANERISVWSLACAAG